MCSSMSSAPLPKGMWQITPSLYTVGEVTSEIQLLLLRRFADSLAVWDLVGDGSTRAPRLSSKVREAPFANATVPTLQRLCDTVLALARWHAIDPANVSVLHYAPDTGGVGVVLASFLYYTGVSATPQAAAELLGRPQCGQVAMTCNQLRYARYFADLLSRDSLPQGSASKLESVRVEPMGQTLAVEVYRHMDENPVTLFSSFDGKARGASKKQHVEVFPGVEVDEDPAQEVVVVFNTFACARSLKLWPEELDCSKRKKSGRSSAVKWSLTCELRPLREHPLSCCDSALQLRADCPRRTAPRAPSSPLQQQQQQQQQQPSEEPGCRASLPPQRPSCPPPSAAKPCKPASPPPPPPKPARPQGADAAPPRPQKPAAAPSSPVYQGVKVFVPPGVPAGTAGRADPTNPFSDDADDAACAVDRTNPFYEDLVEHRASAPGTANPFALARPRTSSGPSPPSSPGCGPRHAIPARLPPPPPPPSPPGSSAQPFRESLAAFRMARADDEARAAEQAHRDAQRELQRAQQREARMVEALGRRSVASLSCADLADVLAELGLCRYAQQLRANRIAGDVVLAEVRDLCMAREDRKKFVHALRTVEASGHLRLTHTALQALADRCAPGDVATRDALLCVTWSADEAMLWVEDAGGISPNVRRTVCDARLTGEELVNLEAEDLEEMGVRASGDRRRFLNATSALQRAHFEAIAKCFSGAAGKKPKCEATATATATASATATATAAATSAAATRDCSDEEEVPREYLCPITLQLMEEPVVASDGFIYERAAIAQWLAKHSTSPLTKRHMKAEPLILCQTLRSAIMSFKEQRAARDASRDMSD
eukprot:m51a1_g8792 hypothetical protein (830) ;mRNA; f:232309-235432